MEEEKKLKESKYSNRGPIALDSIPIADTNLAIMEFSEGSVSLEKCLRAMWQRNLKTHSCNAKCEEPYNIAYVTMEDNIDVFSYLSEEVIDNDMIQIDYSNERQIIRFAGNKGQIEGAIISLVRDINSGKKRNRELLAKKIGKPFPETWIREYEKYLVRSSENTLTKKLAS